MSLRSTPVPADQPPAPANWIGGAAARFFSALDSVLFPLDCLMCGKDEIDAPFCEECRAGMIRFDERVCERCALGLGPFASAGRSCARCRNRRYGFDAALSLGEYQGSLREACLLLKRPAYSWLADWFAGELVAKHERRLDEEGLGGSAQDERSGWVTAPIPLHWKRHHERGYNQAESLAAALASRLGIRCVKAIKRVSNTAPLAFRSRTERTETMKNAFAISRFAKRRIAGKRVLLADDVMTTGVTLSSAARLLKRMGAKRVVAIFVCRTAAGD